MSSTTKSATVIESAEYAAERQQLREDPLAQGMAAELAAGVAAGHVTLDQFQHESGSPRFEFMQAANNRYRTLGGTHAKTIGAVARVVLAIVEEGQA